ncbi:glycoside hydrolase superfamily [Jimgerdemannia flammicorona]|uniref:Glycoside hydrolase superfamily n=1 Tax=Jimgerdemannia flammicorona TaxID=994334 RepID=A0A433QJ20_9FUNG|nr:glycoside hydrolase superfamily [Jimgerdemannia flammicorona]
MFIKASFALQPPQPCWPVSSPQILPSTPTAMTMSLFTGVRIHMAFKTPVIRPTGNSTADVINVSFLITVSDTQERARKFNHFPQLCITQLPQGRPGYQDLPGRRQEDLSLRRWRSRLSSTAQVDALALKIWNNYLGGSSSKRPFGDAKMDGVDFDIEAGSGTYYDEVMLKLRQLFAGGTSKSYYISSAPRTTTWWTRSRPVGSIG